MALAVDLEASTQAVLEAIARGELTASPGYRCRLEGAQTALGAVLETSQRTP